MPEQQKKPSPKEHYFFSRAVSCRIANFTEEKRDGAGRITQPEGSIRFYDHMYVTSVPKEVRFIRQSDAFENGDVRECESADEVKRLTMQRDAMKYAPGRMDEKAEHNESTIIKSGNN